jgi:serine/threonine protein kinase
LRREDEFGDHDDADLIPTLERLRKSFPTAAELEPLLQCDCDLCGPQQQLHNDVERVRALAYDISRSDEKLRAFATLVLAGCLFAWREFSRRVNDDLSDFSKRVKAENATGSDLRRRLFARVTSDECDHTAYARLKLRRQCPECAGNAFRDGIRAKLRLLRIPVLQRTSMIEEYDEFDNLPFVQEDSDQVESSKATVRFWRCRVEPTHCTIDEAKSFELFRKRYRFTPGDRGIRQAVQEAEVAMALGSLDHDNIAKVLLAFKEDSEHTYVNLVFKREPHNLADYFKQPTLCSLFGGFQGRDGLHAVLLDHGLWKASMGLVDAVATLHEVADGKIIPRRTGPKIYGHFDLKPANILIGDGGNLLLTDFGQAATRTKGTSDYAPPEYEHSGHEPLHSSYDTWSLACILLQVLIYTSALSESDSGAGCRALESFYSRRHNQTTRNRDGAFWIKLEHGGGQKMLREAVIEELYRLEARRHHQTKVVVQQLRLMLEIDPRARPTTVRACYKKFKSGLGRDVFRSPGDRLIEPRLAEWLVVCAC